MVMTFLGICAYVIIGMAWTIMLRYKGWYYVPEQKWLQTWDESDIVLSTFMWPLWVVISMMFLIARLTIYISDLILKKLGKTV